MADTTFKPQQTVIASSWLQDVNNAVYRAIGAGGVAPVTPSQVVVNLGLVCSSIANLRLLDKTRVSFTMVTGYYAAHDGGGGPYVLDPTDTTTADNRITVIVAADGGRWKLCYTTHLSVKQAGAKGDGTTDDTTAINAADAVARALGLQLYFPGATYRATQLVVYTGSNWLGDGRDATIIKQIVGANTDLIYGNNSNANWGSSSPTTIVNGWAIQGMTFDGQWNAGAGNTSGSGIAIYGARPIMRDVFIKNCAEYGMRTEYTDGPAGGDDTFAMEGHFENIRIDTVGKHGWWNNGPHDSVVIDMIVVDAGQQATNTWDGFYYDAKSTGRNIGNHAWTRGSSLRMRYALNLQPGAQHEFTGGCNFEGAYSANVGIFSSNSLFDSSTRYYAAWNGVNIFMGRTATLNTVKGWLGGPGSGRPACIGIYLGSISGDFIANNNIDLLMEVQEAGNIQFTAFDGGNNVIRINAYNTTSASFGGVPAATDDFEMHLQNAGGTSQISNRHQKASIAMTSNGSSTWNFPFPFNGNPVVTFSCRLPSGNFSAGAWITSLSSTSVTIFNNNAITGTFDISADAVN